MLSGVDKGFMHLRKWLVTNSVAALVESNKRRRERRNPLLFCFTPEQSDYETV